MQKIKGHKLRDVLDQKPGLAQKTGEIVAELHNQDIIHGDLTTSNLILSPENKLFLIDFGLSFHSQKIEDKAVDIHLFKQALESKHHKVYDQALKLFMKGYKKSNNYEQIIARLEKVEARGRYKK